MNRGEIWLTQVGRKTRPVLVLTRSEVIEARSRITVAEVTTNARGLSVEVALDHGDIGLARPSVVNCDVLHTVATSTLTTYVGAVDDETMSSVCNSVAHALGC